MSRAKRVRKARMATRIAKRLDKRIAAASAVFSAFAVDVRERARVRAEINASAAPEALKTVLGYLVDPLGTTADMANREMNRRKEEEP